MDKRVLIAEDEPISGKLLQEVIGSTGAKALLTGNGRDALAAFEKAPFPVVVTDIEMPEMDGKELIKRLSETEQPPVIIVQTVHSELPMVIDIMKSGAYDYIVKPVDVNDFRVKVERALEAAELRRMRRVVEREKVIRIERELEWYHWNESVVNRELKRMDKSLFHSLHTAFNQGAGFGALLTLLKLLSDGARREGDHYVVDGRLMEVINDNVAIADKILMTFADIDLLIAQKIPVETVGHEMLYGLVRETAGSMEKYAGLKKQRLVLSDEKPAYADKKLGLNRRYFVMALEELLVNAFKFSEEGSSIYLLVDMVEGDFQVSVVSEPVSDEQGRTGIPLGYENIVLEPFFRMTKAVFEGYDTLDYGLGLALADKIAKAHGGRLRISNIIDYTGLTRDPETKVMATLSVPHAA